ncbi:MAG: HAMP domain-containing histidine kinase [Eubacterium sp.]|nr:HAMP domain-containing histidine kinase [Eubacterium sp.]
MLYFIFTLAAACTAGFFAFRYTMLVRALAVVTGDLYELQADLTQNQILRLPMPDCHLAKLLAAFNKALGAMQAERWSYEKRERKFQAQIENISHDLRTPLTVILGYLKLYKNSHYEQMDQDPELAETMEIVEHKAEVMKGLVTQFYDYSRLQAEDYSLTLQNLDIARMLRESFLGNCEVLEQNDLRVDLKVPHEPVWGLADQAALERIFQNLFQNAGRYADTYLDISMRADADGVHLFFMNDTRLLSKEDIPHLFERFYIQDRARNQGGTGLGLTVAKKLAEEMDGTLQVEVFDAANEGALDSNRKGGHTGQQGGGRLTVCFALRLNVPAAAETT